MDNNQPETTSHNGPAHVLRDGRLKITIWRNEGEHGSFPSLEYAKTISGQDGKPRDVHSFSETDNLRMQHLSKEAHTVVRHLKREWAKERLQSNDQERQDFKDARRHADGQKSPRKSRGF